MAITALYEETRKLQSLHNAEVVMCSVPGDPPFLKYAWFKNDNYILDLESVLKRCGHLNHLLLHIPDYRVNRLVEWLSASQALLKNIEELHLNVLAFNIDLMQGQNVTGLEQFGSVTCTTAHQAYSNLTTREAVGVATHSLLICKGAEFYSPTGYEDKEQLLVVSPDAHPFKELVLQQIARELPGLRIQVIAGLTYDEFASLIRRAKWSLTFGEGLDGFFVEPVFSGSISFAVFNERFFTPAFADLETVYPSWDILLERIVEDIRRLDEPMAYNQGWQQAYDLLSQHLDTNRFRENLRSFYRGEYTFP